MEDSKNKINFKGSSETKLKRLSLIIFVYLLLVSCGKVSQKEYDNIKIELDSLKSELRKYKDKYGDIPLLDKKSGKFGIWKVNYYVNDFGEKTKEGYVSTELNGTFSNSATTDSDLKVVFIIDRNSIRIQLYEYGNNHPIKGKGILDFKAKDKNGKIYEFMTFNNKSGDNTFIDSTQKLENTVLINLLLKGGNIMFFGSTSEEIPSEYHFSITNADYLAEAISKI